jgi:hypothetical protein
MRISIKQSTWARVEGGQSARCLDKWSSPTGGTPEEGRLESA